MSTTPRTDAAWAASFSPDRANFSVRDECEKLETELAQLRAEVSEARRAWLGDDYGHLPLIEALEKFRSDSDAESERADVLYQRSCEVEHKLRAEVERLKGALALGQENCDSIYNDMRKERTELTARAERAEAAELDAIASCDALVKGIDQFIDAAMQEGAK